MRIGLIAEHYPPAPGGVATSSQRIARGLASLGAEVYVFCFDNSEPIVAADYVIEEIDQGIPVTRIGPFFLRQAELNLNVLSEKVKAALRRRVFNRVLKMMRENAVDVVMSMYLLEAGFLGQFLAAGLSVPHLAGVRGNDIGLNIFHVDRFGVIQWIVNRADSIVCVNEHLRKRLLLAFPESKTKSVVITNSIAVTDGRTSHSDARRQLLRASGWQNEDFIVTFIGTLREKKGIVTLLKAIDQVAHLPVKLLVIGPEIGNADAALCGNLLVKLREEKRLFITGMVPREDVMNWAKGADAVVMPSSDDGLANGLLEGMAMGLCPIASEIFSGVVRNEENGILFPSEEVAPLAEAFSRLARDRATARIFGQNAKAFVNIEHHPQKEFSSYMNLLRDIVRQH
jgi:glycosyltransferase involved in cell wall biosynthesis